MWHEYPADWNTLGRKAGHVRNIEMAKNADALVACWDGVSRGTEDMIKIARSEGLAVFVINISDNKEYRYNKET